MTAGTPPSWSAVHAARRLLHPSDDLTMVLERAARRLSDADLLRLRDRLRAIESGTAASGLEHLSDEALLVLEEQALARVLTTVEADSDAS